MTTHYESVQGYIASEMLANENDTKFIIVENLDDSNTEDNINQISATDMMSDNGSETADDESGDESNDERVATTYKFEGYQDDESSSGNNVDIDVDNSDSEVDPYSSDGSDALHSSQFNLINSAEYENRSALIDNMVSNTTQSNTDNTTYDKTDDKTNDKTDENTNVNTDDNHNDKTDENTNVNTDDNHNDKTDENTNVNTDDKPSNKTDENTNVNTDDKPSNKTNYSTAKNTDAKSRKDQPEDVKNLIKNRYLQILAAGATGLVLGFLIGMEYKSSNKSC